MIIRSKSLIFIMGLLISGLVLSSQPSFCKGPWGKNKNQIGAEGQGKRLLEQEASDFDSDKGKQRSGAHGAVGAEAARIKALFDQAEALTREGSTKAELDTAISKLQEALRIAQKKDIARAAARAYVQLGLIHLWRSELDKSLEYNEKAIKEAKKSGNCKALSAATRNIGNVHKARGQYDEALKDISQAVKIAEDCGHKTGVAWALWNWAEVCKFQGKYDEALKQLQKGLEVASEIQNSEIEAYIRQETGVVYTFIGQYSQAADYLQEALAIGEQIKKPRIEQESLGGLGDLYFAQGKYRLASDYFQKTLDRARLYGDKRRETLSLISQGKVYAEWGRYRDALACFQDALGLAKTTGIVLHQPRILVDMGAIFSSRGQYQKATSLFEQALDQFREMGITKGEAHVLENLGLIYQTSGEYDKALNYFQQGLEICKKIGLPTRAACRNIGNLYLDMGDTEKAEPFILESNYPGPLGRLYLAKADYLSAKKCYERLFQSAELNRSARNLFTSCTGLGLAYEGMGDDPKAAEYYRKAVEYTEAIRSALSPAERETFFDVKIEGFYRTTPYEGLARILVKMKKPLEAFKESEYTRARIFAEAISRRAEYGGYDIPPDIRDQDASLTDELASLTKNLQNAYENENKDQIASLEPQVKEIKEKFAAHVDMLRDRYPLFAATHYPQPMDLNKTALRDDEWTLAYHVTDPGILIYVAKGKNLVSCHFKPITRKELDGLVRRFREPVEITPGDDIKNKLRAFDFTAGKRLYDLILADALSTIPANRPIVVIPDDSLGVIPFEMLPMSNNGKIAEDKEIPYTIGAEFVGDRNPISYYQSATALTLARIHGKSENQDGKLLLYADPVFQAEDTRAKTTDKREPAPRVKQHHIDLMNATAEDSVSGEKIPRLPLTSTLAQNLAAMYGGSAECHTGLDASKDKFLKQVAPGLTNYEQIIFATHGYFGSDLPGIMEPVLILSLIPAGTDGYLRMSEVAGLKMSAEVVALTACQTGLGKRISGEGTMGMGRSFQYAGARSVLMSMWSVAERSSVTLVENFFKHLKSGKTRLEALRLARSDIRQAGYDHPFFWAPFILVGEVQ